MYLFTYKCAAPNTIIHASLQPSPGSLVVTYRTRAPVQGRLRVQVLLPPECLGINCCSWWTSGGCQAKNSKSNAIERYQRSYFEIIFLLRWQRRTTTHLTGAWLVGFIPWGPKSRKTPAARHWILDNDFTLPLRLGWCVDSGVLLWAWHGGYVPLMHYLMWL